MLRPTLPRIGHSLRTFRRSLHQVPPLVHNFQDGIPDFLSPQGFEIAWTQYQSLMCEKLSALTAGGEYENRTAKDVLLKYARDSNSAPLFNYASMAHNNHFFFSGLSPVQTSIPAPLQRNLEDSFSSIETLRREFIVTASAMFGPGFVWLVKTKEQKFSLLTTYLGGSPYPGAHYRRQTVDMNTEENTSRSESVSALLRSKLRGPPVNQVGAHGPLSRKEKAPGGIELTPVLCLNTWEHVYLPDYGVGAAGTGGKTAYAQNWWHKIDWNVVYNHANTKTPFLTH